MFISFYDYIALGYIELIFLILNNYSFVNLINDLLLKHAMYAVKRIFESNFFMACKSKICGVHPMIISFVTTVIEILLPVNFQYGHETISKYK